MLNAFSLSATGTPKACAFSTTADTSDLGETYTHRAALGRELNNSITTVAPSA